jgi:hypothetical protein
MPLNMVEGPTLLMIAAMMTTLAVALTAEP